MSWKQGLFIVVDAISILPFAMVIGFPYLLIGPSSYNSSNPKNKSKIVVLIHGSGVRDWQWAVAKLYLHISKISFMSVNYNSELPIEISSDIVFEQITKHLNKINQVKTLVESNECKEKENEIILIGHSQGGLISRLIHNRVKSKMTFLMNTPQKGACLLNWLYPNNGENHPCSRNDMRPNSEFLQNLPDADPNEICEIIGTNDVVLESESIHFGNLPHQILNNEKHVYRSRFGHFFCAVNPYLWFSYVIPLIKRC
jgi:hypothetical protein